MNNQNGHAPERSLPRWTTEAAETPPPTAAERAVLAELLASMRRVRHGSIQIAIQDSKVVQIDTTEKRRL
jgi:hypothetical protein